MESESTPPTQRDRAKWAGRILSVVIAVLMLFSGVMKVSGGAAMEEAIEPLGLPVSMMLPLGLVEMLCAFLFIIPQTAVIGAILLTGYLGGAIVTHWRVGDWFLIPIVIAILVWVAMALREPRLWRLIPWRR